MPSLTCRKCETKIQFTPMDDIAVCMQCGKDNRTGREKQIREHFERLLLDAIYPEVTVARAAAYSAEIYGYATDRIRIDYGGIENAIKRKFGPPYKGTPLPGLRTEDKRQFVDREDQSLMTDQGVGVMVIPVLVGEGELQIYIVFRGSRGDPQGQVVGRRWIQGIVHDDLSYWTKKDPKRKNPEGAGWDNGRNLDWRANLFFRPALCPWWGGSRVHAGFLELYGSVQSTVLRALQRIPGSQQAAIIVTGHSLGAGLAILCASHLESLGIHAFCYPFCPPRAADSQFAQRFEVQIASRRLPLSGDVHAGQLFHRSILFTQQNDPVSWELGSLATNLDHHKQGHGFARPDTAGARRTADSGSFAKQSFYAMKTKTQDKRSIFYHVPNVMRVMGLFENGYHSFDTMEMKLLGWNGERP